jgi:transposase
MARFLVPQRSIVVMRECSLEETLPAGHLARFIWSALERIDFGAIEGRYQSVAKCSGRPPYHPRILAALWIYGMTRGMGTASEIAEGCSIRDDFRWLAGGLSPCDQTFLNFLSICKEDLPSIWEQVLKAMQAAGHIDLSVLAEDGTKLRADASRRSFHSTEEIAAVVEKLKGELARKLTEAVSPEASKKHQVELRGLKSKLERAMQAAEELERRREKREGRGEEEQSLNRNDANLPSGPKRRSGRFGRADFRHDAERDVMLCPEGKELRFVGVYPNDNGRGSYRLFRRLDCSDCHLKAGCTDAKGRVLKIQVVPEQTPGTPAEIQPPTIAGQTPETNAEGSQPSASKDQEEKSPATAKPQGSLTDPEAVLMLATSEKRWEPSFNADITVTRQEVIVSHFLTKDPTDYHHFPRALPNVLSTLGHPTAWSADGHYGTVANLALAEKEGVLLYAPTQQREERDKGSFTIKDFRYDADRDVLVCPAGRDLERIGTYGQDHGRPYDLYQNEDCSGCELKSRCTTARRRRIKKHHQSALVQALDARMERDGEKMRKFRGSTVEPVHSQLKQHGLQRFHVRGLERCATVLTLACIAHNLMKWRGMEESGLMRVAS